MPFNHVWHPRNLLVKLATYPRILDGINSLTFLDEFCMRSWRIAMDCAPGIYHAAYPTPVRTVDVARLLYVTGVRTLPFELYDPAEFIADGHVRRSAAVLDSSKFEKAFGAPFGDPFCALRWCIDRLKENRSKSCSCSQSTSTSITTSTSRSAAVR